MNHLIDALIEGVTYGTAGDHFFWPGSSSPSFMLTVSKLNRIKFSMQCLVMVCLTIVMLTVGIRSASIKESLAGKRTAK